MSKIWGWKRDTDKKLECLHMEVQTLRESSKKDKNRNHQLAQTIKLMEEGGTEMREAIENTSLESSRRDKEERRLRGMIESAEEARGRYQIKLKETKREATAKIRALEVKLKEARRECNQIVRKYNDALDQSGHVVYNLPEGKGRLVRKDVYDDELLAREKKLDNLQCDLTKESARLKNVSEKLRLEKEHNDLLRREQLRVRAAAKISERETRVRNLRIAELEKQRRRLWQQRSRAAMRHEGRVSQNVVDDLKKKLANAYLEMEKLEGENRKLEVDREGLVERAEIAELRAPDKNPDGAAAFGKKGEAWSSDVFGLACQMLCCRLTCVQASRVLEIVVRFFFPDKEVRVPSKTTLEHWRSIMRDIVYWINIDAASRAHHLQTISDETVAGGVSLLGTGRESTQSFPTFCLNFSYSPALPLLTSGDRTAPVVRSR